MPTPNLLVEVTNPNSVTVPDGLATAAKQDELLAALSDGTQSTTVRGVHPNGATSGEVELDATGALRVSLADPLSVMGELVTVAPTPRVQIDAVYGALTTDIESLTSGTGAVGTASAGLFRAESGTSSGGYGVIRSRRICRYRPGQACRIMFTARFGPPVADAFQAAGGFTSTDGVFFGYEGTTFGALLRGAGAAAIQRLTVSAGSAGAETVTVTLDGVAFTVATGGALTTDALARAIAARAGGYTGWTSAASPTANGSTVTFIQSVPGTTTGAFSMASTGAAAGTFVQLQAGAPNDLTTNFVPQSAWNRDRLDGTSGANNPSGMLLDTLKLNVFEIGYSYLGAGAIRFRVMTPSGRWATVHVMEYPNSAVSPKP